jgi:hypothetical protein
MHVIAFTVELFQLGLEIRANVSANLFKSLQVSNIEDLSAPLGHKDHVSVQRMDHAASLAGLDRPSLDGAIFAVYQRLITK